MSDYKVFCSTVIPTVNRTTLSRAVYSVLDQNFQSAEFEVIVVNDSGQQLPDTDWQHSSRVRVINTNQRERSVARNTGAAIARGKYLHFLDDDDVIVPGALDAFWKTDKKVTDETWLFGSWLTTDNYGNKVDEFQPDLNGNIFALLVSGEGLPLQASFISTKHFFKVGAFDPDPILIGVEDRDLGRRLALTGSIAHIQAIVAQIRIGEQTSTTNWSKIADGDRWGREKALNAPRAFTRLHTSANSSYWRGRVSRAYVASMVWNVTHGMFSIAASRAVLGLAIANLHIFSPSFWQGLRTKIK